MSLPSDAASVRVDTLAVGRKKIGRLTLNRPQALNALTLEMLDIAYRALLAWATDPDIAFIFMDGAGDRGFSAGGDVTSLYKAIKEPGTSAATALERCQAFFVQEYRLDFLIHSYTKPIVAWGDGIVMGGGLGLIAGASHRVVTEKTLLAMPEISIGLFPDVGASYFLNKMPEGLGLFIGLTGARLNGGDALYVGLGDHYILSQNKEDVLAALQNVKADDSNRLAEHITAALKPFGRQPPHSILEDQQNEISEIMEGANVHEVVAGILAADWSRYKILSEAQDSLRRGSPGSSAIIFRQIKGAEGLSLASAFRRELIIAVQSCRHHDFPEGVRALLIDKDRAPQWNPKTLAAVTAEYVAEFFEAPWAREAHPLADL